MKRMLLAAAVLPLAMTTAPLAAATPDPAGAAAVPAGATAQTAPEATVPRQLTPAEAARFRTIFAHIRGSRWAEAKAAIDAEQPSPLAHFARAELFVARGSPRVELPELNALLAAAPVLPQAERLARLATTRGGTALLPLPPQQRLIWRAGAPVRTLAASNARQDAVAAELARRMQPLIKDDRARDAEALLDATSGLSPAAEIEWRQRVAWIYYLNGDDANARRVATRAAAAGCAWAVQADWTIGLAAGRMGDMAAALGAFTAVGTRATDPELRAAGLYWSGRAAMAGARPELVQGQLRTAAAFDETFYGQLAVEALGMTRTSPRMPAIAPAEWAQLERRPNVAIAAALTEIGEDALADTTLRHQARIGTATDHVALMHLAARLDLPATQLWLSHNLPQGVVAPVASRYPVPRWNPDDGLRIDRSLLFAHTLQESRFRTEVTSPAGAFGLMQIMPSAATDFSRRTGRVADREALRRPQVNMAIGQSHIEMLRDRAVTSGLLPKVIAAFNAGLTPVERWNVSARDGGDPLLYIESIPYWETRFYVGTVLRNYWMYQAQAGERTPSRAALAQGMWPRVPGMRGEAAVRIAATGGGGGGSSAGGAH